MSDMGEVYREMREIHKQYKHARLARADDTGWSKHTSHHWYIDTRKGRLNYWPSTGTAMLAGRRVRRSSKYILELLSEEGVVMNE